VKKRTGFFVLGSLALLVFALLLVPQSTPPAEVDYDAIAQKLVSQCAAVHEGELIFINGGPKDFELLEDIAVHVRKAGGNPLISFGSDRLTKRMWTEVPEKYDAQSREPWVKFAGLVSAGIYVSYNEDEGLLADIPAGRLMASNNADAAINDALRKNNYRNISLGNGLYPTAQLAQRYGLSKDELARIFWDCVNVDYSELQNRCEAVKSVLAAGNELRITNPNGTDFKVRIAGRPVLFSDGVISEEDLKKGYAACQVWLPAGEVYVTPIAGTAEGKIVVDRDYIQGKEISGWTLVFKAGRLVSMSAKSGLERLQALYDAAGAGKDEFAFVDLGVNPKLGEGAGSGILNYVRGGMITIGVGNNVWAGGSNNATFAIQTYLPGCTLKVDKKPLIEKGKLLR
jgi:aminopeptidase